MSNNNKPRHSPPTAVLERQGSAGHMLDFPSAIREVIRGRAVTRFEWMNPAIYLVMTEGYLKIRKADTTQHVLLVSDADMLADDWRIVSMDDDDGA